MATRRQGLYRFDAIFGDDLDFLRATPLRFILISIWKLVKAKPAKMSALG